MDFFITCECGKNHPVTEGQAGGRLACDCGRSVAVPALGELRRQAGLAAYRPSPVHLINHLRAAGDLLSGESCARCGVPTDQTVTAVADCERAWTERSDRSEGILVTVLFGVLGYLIWQSSWRRESAEVRVRG